MSSDSLSQSPKTVLLTVIITAASSLGASFIGIVPQLRQNDLNKISILEDTVTKLNNLSDLLKSGGSSGEKWTISGKVQTANNNSSVKAAEVYLIPSTGSDLMSTTGDGGEFVFNKVAPGSYWLVMRDPNKNGASRVLIPIKSEDGSDRLNEKIGIKGTSITYDIVNKR